MSAVGHVTTIAESLDVLLLAQLRHLSQRGFAVTGLSAPGPAVANLENNGIRHLAVPFVRASGLTPLRDARAMAHLARVFWKERFAIVHTHTAKPDLYAAMAARAARVPIVVTTLHGFYFHDLMPARTRAFYIRLARLGMRFVDVVLSQNEEDVVTAERERICPPSKIELLGNGIDLARFERTRVAPEVVARRKHELGIPPGAPVIGYVGRLVKEKGLDELLEAMVILRDRFPTARLVLVGMVDEAKQDSIGPEAALRSGLGETCIFTGHRSDVVEHYALMDVCVLPSHREGFPRTLMEAAAMEVPVVATNIRGCRSAVADGRNGLLVPVHDAQELARAIGVVLEDPTRRREMGAEGRSLALARFDEQRVFARVAATYTRLLTTHGIPLPVPG